MPERPAPTVPDPRLAAIGAAWARIWFRAVVTLPLQAWAGAVARATCAHSGARHK